jgi:surface carbohydrate biosynthesis protein (TIGR04326 family)
MTYLRRNGLLAEWTVVEKYLSELPGESKLKVADLAAGIGWTSAAADAYVAGLSVIIGLDGAHLNLSPLRGQQDVHSVSSPEGLAQALLAAGEKRPAHRDRDELFFLDRELPRWHRLLEFRQL